MLKLDYDDFLNKLNIGHEIEIRFRGIWYFFSSKKKRGRRDYIFYVMNEPWLGEYVYSESQDLCNIKIQGCTLRDVLAELQDYIIY